MKDNKRIIEIIKYIELAYFVSNTYSENESKPNKNIIADIASDHGYIGFEALKRDLAFKVIFTDISVKSLQKAMNLINSSDFLQFSEFRVGDGLSVLKENIFASVIAGIGGREIVKILSHENKKYSKFFILQTSQDDAYLRKSLPKMNFRILCDRCMFFMGHVYHTMLVCDNATCYNQINIDRLVLDYFVKSGEISLDIYNHQSLIDEYFKFQSDFYGKNNMFVSTLEHKNNIEFQINRYKNILVDTLENKEKCLNCENKNDNSINKYLSDIQSRLVVLDKIYKSIL